MRKAWRKMPVSHAILLRYLRAAEKQAGLKLPRDPQGQLQAAIKAMQAAAPNLPLLISLMSPYDLATRSLRARLISRDPETGQVGVVGQRLRSRLIGDFRGQGNRGYGVAAPGNHPIWLAQIGQYGRPNPRGDIPANYGI